MITITTAAIMPVVELVCEFCSIVVGTTVLAVDAIVVGIVV